MVIKMNKLYEDFVTDYNNPNITAHDVRRINNLNSKQYSNFRKIAIRNGDIPKVRHMNQTSAKFYSKRSDGYYDVQKYINGKKMYIGKFPDQNTAELVVDMCKSVNWDLNKVNIDNLKVLPKNYSIVNGYYIIQKSVNGVNTVFATIHSSKVDEDTIKEIVNRFRCFGWNLSCKDKVLKEFDI